MTAIATQKSSIFRASTWAGIAVVLTVGITSTKFNPAGSDLKYPGRQTSSQRTGKSGAGKARPSLVSVRQSVVVRTGFPRPPDRQRRELQYVRHDLRPPEPSARVAHSCH